MDEQNEVEQLKGICDLLLDKVKALEEMLNAADAKTEALNKFVMEQIVAPSIENQKEEEFKNFDEKYGERLSKFDPTLKIANNDEDYSASRETFNGLAEMPEADRKNVNVDEYVNTVELSLSEYVSNIKKSLGIPEDEPVNITEDGNGNTEVNADIDGDGNKETVTETAEEKTAETPEGETKVEEVKAETEEEPEEDEAEVDPELLKQIEEWSKQ